MSRTSPMILSSELRTSAPMISSALRPGASSSMAMSGLASFSSRRPRVAPRCTFGSRGDLLVGLILVVVAQGVHRGSCDKFADVGQETLAIGMTPVGPEREGGVPQAAQVAHALAIGQPAKLWLLQDRFFELGVSDLAVRHGSRDTERAQESGREEKSCWFHRWSDLWDSGLARHRSFAQWVSTAFKRVETAVMIWAGAKGLATMRLFGTPFDDHSGALSPLM